MKNANTNADLDSEKAKMYGGQKPLKSIVTSTETMIFDLPNMFGENEADTNTEK